MGQLGIIQNIKCLFGFHVMNPFNYYNKYDELYYQNGCINCWRKFEHRFIRKLTEEEKDKPIWEILGTTEEIYYDRDNSLRAPFLIVCGEK